MQKISLEQIDNFWKARARFLKTNLTTETPNSHTYNLSELCSSNIQSALKLFHDIESSAVKKLLTYTSSIAELSKAVNLCINKPGKLYLVGCGASARLAVLLRRLWEIEYPTRIGQVVSVASAGDVSLIKSVEQFEDSEEFGIAQLKQQGFTKNDLLIGLSASGESPFILACIKYAAEFSLYNPWLVCNNSPADLIARNSNHIIQLNTVKSLTLNVGEMALTGSTRLQATTAMQIAIGIAILEQNNSADYIANKIHKILLAIDTLDLSYMDEITQLESKIISNNEFVLYQTNDNLLGLSMLADLTERSPTFNIAQFENYARSVKTFSPFYLSIVHANSKKQAWLNLLGQTPLCLNWPQFEQTSESYMDGFDISNNSPRNNTKLLPKKQYTEAWLIDGDNLNIKLDNHTAKFYLPKNNNLCSTIIYKLILNAHSTIMFGRLGFYDGNLMLSLTPSNFKLMDRAIRYCQFILDTKYNKHISYEQIAEILFSEAHHLETNQSIVKKIIARIIS